MKRLCILAGLSLVLFGFGSAPVVADIYPSRAVTIVVPYPAGGSVDGVARIIAQKLTEALGQAFIVENRAGGVGGIGKRTSREVLAAGLPDLFDQAEN